MNLPGNRGRQLAQVRRWPTGRRHGSCALDIGSLDDQAAMCASDCFAVRTVSSVPARERRLSFAAHARTVGARVSVVRQVADT